MYMLIPDAQRKPGSISAFSEVKWHSELEDLWLEFGSTFSDFNDIVLGFWSNPGLGFAHSAAAFVVKFRKRGGM